MPERNRFPILQSPTTRRLLLGLVVILLSWWMYLAFVGGVSTRILGIRVSSNEAWRPMVAALVCAVVYLALARRAVREDLAWSLDQILSGAAPAAVAVALAGGAVATTWSTRAASGADSYGYVSQADLWLRGELIVAQPVMAQLHLPNRNAALAPLGYRPGLAPNTLVPTYAPGLPILMAGAKALFGACALYLVVPALTVLLIYTTYLLGRCTAGPPEGLAAAVLVASSPIVLRMSVLPMTDVPVAATWTAAAALTASLLQPEARPRHRTARLAAAGAFTALTILIRPNLAPLGGIIVCAMIAGLRKPPGTYRSVLSALFVFGTIAAIGALSIAAYNAHLYGSPVRTGYGEGMFRWAHVLPNMQRYPRWLVDSQTPVVVLALVPLLGRWLGPTGRLSGVAFILLYGTIAVTFLSYVSFFMFDAWWFLRYLMPAIPPIAIATVVGSRWLMRRLVGSATPWAALLAVLFLAIVSVRVAIREDAFRLWPLERRYLWVGRYIQDHTSPNAAIICMQHSGSLRYYGGRLTIRYDEINDLDGVVRRLRESGYKPYIVLEDWERVAFIRRFGAKNGVGRLDWLPIARLEEPVRVEVFDPEVRPLEGEQVIIPPTEPACGGSPARVVP